MRENSSQKNQCKVYLDHSGSSQIMEEERMQLEESDDRVDQIRKKDGEYKDQNDVARLVDGRAHRKACNDCQESVQRFAVRECHVFRYGRKHRPQNSFLSERLFRCKG